MNFKVCSKCKIEKSLDNFHISKRDGYRSRCKECKKVDDKIWRTKNKEKDLEIKKNWRDSNKEYMVNYYNENKEHLKEYLREYYIENRNDILYNVKKNYNFNRESKIESSKNYYRMVKDSEEFKEKRRKIANENYKKNPHVHAHRRILKRHLMLIGLEKCDRTSNLLGYTSLDLKNHMEKLFKDGMSWDNYGEWHIDHIKPISKFDISDDTSVVNALENLQPLWAFENLSKGGKYE